MRNFLADASEFVLCPFLVKADATRFIGAATKCSFPHFGHTIPTQIGIHDYCTPNSSLFDSHSLYMAPRSDLGNRRWTSESRNRKYSTLGSMVFDQEYFVGTALSLLIAVLIFAGAGLELAHRLPDAKH